MNRSESLTYELDHVIEAGLAAPSMHNTQPWRFAVTADQTILVTVDESRLLPIGDPDGRALHLATGAALFNMLLAARHLGLEPKLTLRPGDTSLALGRLALDPSGGATFEEHLLYNAIWRRHTSRRPFRERWEIPPKVLGQLIEAASLEGATLRVLTHDETRRTIRLARHANRILSTDEQYRTELSRWTHNAPDRRDGVPASWFGPPPGTMAPPMLDFSLGGTSSRGIAGKYEELPDALVLSTQEDDPLSWLRAGMALERVLLVATVCRLRASFLHQVVQLPTIRAQLRRTLRSTSYPQAVVRIGYGSVIAGTPRRLVDEVAYRADASDERRSP